MVKTLELANGMFVSMAVAEVTSVPYYELFAKDLDRANYSNQVLFTQILQAMHRKSDAENTAFEFLFQSIGVDNQTYKAQVRLYIIVRKIGDVKLSNESFILDMMSSIKNDLEDKNFSVSVLDTESEYSAFEKTLAETDCSKVLSISKKEKVIGNALSANASQAINSLDQTINSFKSRVDVKVNDVNTSTANIQATTNRIYENIEKFKTEMLHGEEKQIAHENILRIDQIIKEQFSNHIAIRRTVMGVVRDFDINLVRNSTIQELSEELWITSSRYWLSYALIAITAWVNNYPDVAKNALAESGRKDAIKTTLFFCLMNMRFGRMDAAKKWFYEYFKTLDPTMLQQETAILLQSFLNGIFGKDKELEQEVIQLIDEWISIINDNEQISNELLDAYEKYIANLNTPVQFTYQSVLQFCTNASEVAKSYKDVSKFEILLEFVKSLDVESEPQDSENYKSRIDAILMNLISNYDAEELELKKQQEYYRFIVENNGVVEQAEAQYQAMEDLSNNQFNIGKQMLKWAIYDDSDQTDVQVRKFGFQNTKAWFKKAVDNFDAKLQEAFPTQYNLHIDTWDGVSNGNDQAEQVESLKNHFENNKFQNMFVNTPNILAAILFIVSAGLAFVTLYSLIVTALAAGFLVFRVLQAIKAYPLRVQAAVDSLNACMGELAEFRRYFDEKRTKKDELLSTVEFL